MYEHGTREQPADRRFDDYPDPQLGKFERFEVQPKDREALQFLLREEKESRDKLKPGDFKEHIAALHEGMIDREARRIVADMKKLSAPNSPDKSHFMVELSPSFMFHFYIHSFHMNFFYNIIIVKKIILLYKYQEQL